MMSLTFGLFTQVSSSGPLGPLVLSCMVGFQKYMGRYSVACKDHVTCLKVKVTIHTYAI